ncbi:hypothetical protein [Paenibacillus sp. FSL K6-2393]|uniref:hypothetical protein n=1 Tax=Paenibacillus sp. FSL K6-2393 TaxID=2921475 RepID=UPI0030FCCED9
MNTIWTILVSIGGTSIVTIGIVKWLSGLVQSKIQMSWDHTYKKELEIIKANLTSNQETVKLAFSNLSSNNQKLLEKQIVAVEEIWNHIIKLREGLSPVRMYLSSIPPQEYNEPNEDYFKLFSYKELDENEMNEYKREHKRIEIHRLYVGEYIYNLFGIYRGFILRLRIKFDNHKKANNITEWHTDQHLISIVDHILGDQIRDINIASPGSLNNCIDMIETKILFEIEKLISGSESTEKNYIKARKLMELNFEERDNALKK